MMMQQPLKPSEPFDPVAWSTLRHRANQNGLPFPLVRLRPGTITVRMLDARPLWRVQHFDGGRALLICPETSSCLLCQRGVRRERFGFVRVLDKTDGAVKVLRYSPVLGDRLAEVIVQAGDPRRYDLCIARTGTGLATRYAIGKGDEGPPAKIDSGQAQVRDLARHLQPTTETEMREYLEQRSHQVAIAESSASDDGLDIV